MMTKPFNRRHFLLTTAVLLAATACGGKKAGTRIASGSTVLALGDSLTAGYGAGKGEDYPTQLAQITGWKIINGGVSGNTSAQALERLPELLQQEIGKRNHRQHQPNHRNSAGGKDSCGAGSDSVFYGWRIAGQRIRTSFV